jgi:HAD superfamily hydrolase (TIGR01490 family)
MAVSGTRGAGAPPLRGMPDRDAASGSDAPLGLDAPPRLDQQPPPTAQRAAAFFDLDRTLMEGSSAFQFGRAAFRSGLIGRRQLLSGAYGNLRFRLRGATDAESRALRDRISASLAGVRMRDMRRLGADVLGGILPRIYRPMLSLAYEHQDAGRRVYIVTAAAHELAEALALVLSFDGAIGSRFSSVRDGVFTGEPDGLFLYRAGKARAIRELARRECIDLSASYAYSDSASDLPMLEAVGHPVAVNPDRALARVARERGWEVLRFERLGRRLTTLAASLGAATGAGLAAAALLVRARRPARRPRRSRAFLPARGTRLQSRHREHRERAQDPRRRRQARA